MPDDHDDLRTILEGFTEEEFLWLRVLLATLAEQQKERRPNHDEKT